MSTDLLQIRELQVDTVIGVNAWERQLRQRLLLDLDLPVQADATQDDLAATLDYGAVAEHLREWCAASDHHLIEALAEMLAARLLERFDLPWVRLTVAKPGALAGAAPVRLVIERRA